MKNPTCEGLEAENQISSSRSLPESINIYKILNKYSIHQHMYILYTIVHHLNSAMIDLSAFIILSARSLKNNRSAKTLDDNQDLWNILLLIHSKCHSITRVSVTLSSILGDLQQAVQLSSRCCRELLNSDGPGL